MQMEFRPTSTMGAYPPVAPWPATTLGPDAMPADVAPTDALTCLPGVIGCIPRRPTMPLLPASPAPADPATALADLTKASRKGQWLSVPMHGITASVTLRVTQTNDGFAIERSFRGCFGGSTKTVPVRYADILSGNLSAEACLALREVHEALQPGALSGPDQAPPWVRQFPTLPTQPPYPGPGLPMGPLPGDFGPKLAGERMRITDVAARRQDLEAGVQAGGFGSTGCTSLAGFLGVTRTANGYTLSSASGGFITHRREVAITEAELHSGTLTQEQLNALDDLRRRLTTAPAPARDLTRQRPPEETDPLWLIGERFRAMWEAV